MGIVGESLLEAEGVIGRFASQECGHDLVTVCFRALGFVV